jgi:hypothetical protein
MTFYRSLLTALLFIAAFSANAMDLQEAKSAGWLGEQLDGYLGVVTNNAPPEAQAIANDINAKRKAKYQQLATQNGIDLKAVSTLAGQKAIEKTPAGYYIQNASGQWVKK